MTTARILQLTDLHVFAEPQMRLKGIPTRELLQDVVETVCRDEAPFALIVVTGDHTHDEQRASYQAVRDILEPFLPRLRQVPGNHDDRGLLRDVFADRIPQQSPPDCITFSQPLGDWQCIGLDTHVPGQVSGDLSAAQLRWLQAELDATAAGGVILFMHHPPVDLDSPWMDRIGLAGKERIQDLIHQDERIRLAVCGHVHHASESRVGQARVVTTPSTGIQFSPEGETPNFVPGPPGYRVIEIDGPQVRTDVTCLSETRYAPQDDS